MSLLGRDWTAEGIALLPGICARGAGSDLYAGLIGPQRRIVERLASLQEAIEEPERATGSALDLLGDLIHLDRQGLGDHEYRRLIVGTRAAANAITPPRIHRAWQVLTGSTTVRYTELPPASIDLTAEVGWIPTSAWLARAGAVVRQMIPAGREANATVYTQQSARFGQLPGFGSGRFAYSLIVNGAP